MSSTFIASTCVTLWFTTWTATSTMTYILTILFPFLLGPDYQLEWRWNRQQKVPDKATNSRGSEKEFYDRTRNHMQKWSCVLRFWAANSKWSVQRHGTFAILEFIRAFIGYILMLAVITYNIGILLAVAGSVLLGDLLFGRYTRGYASLAEDRCHS
ncbi:Ctr copper transporter [Phaeosphaeriaceae sp. PMI808]|nr:Ctr copper transporter [Phaeosphaeriaceae sp. PMI808]